jgi:hypothetical protein
MVVAARWCLCVTLLNAACVSKDDSWKPRPDTPAPEAGDTGYDDALAEPCEAVQIFGIEDNRTELGSGLFVDCDPDGEPTHPVTHLHRVDAVTCYYGISTVHECSYPGGDCVNDQDCTDGKYGRCMDRWDGCFCRYDCVTDADCRPDEACLCGSVLPEPMNEPRVTGTRCYPANCRTDADCPGDLRCMVSDDWCGGTMGLWCQTPDDDCATEGDCQALGQQQCFYEDSETRWVCADYVDACD